MLASRAHLSLGRAHAGGRSAACVALTRQAPLRGRSVATAGAPKRAGALAAARERAPAQVARCAPPEAPAPFTNTPDEVHKDARTTVVVPKPQQAPQEKEQVCDFYSHWWPVMPVVDLDASRPMPVDLLGMRLVVWCDKQGAWHCFQDRCPHRLAPLSEGVVQGDTLMCTYHGWQFNQAGKCTVIPQIEDAKAHATACASPRNCVQTYPVKTMQGLLWVYPKPGAVGEAEASAQSVPSMAIPTLLNNDGKFFQATGWFMRDMPLRFETLVENIIDLGHVPFAHHNAAGISKKRNVNPDLTVPDYGHVAPGGFVIRRPAVPVARAAEYDLRLDAPGHASYVYTDPGSGYNQHFLVVPTKPGWSKLFICMVGCSESKAPAAVKFIGKLISRVPHLEHLLLRHEVLDGDTYLLHVAERGLLAAGNDIRTFYMPMNADLPVVMWRKWLAKHAPVVPTCTKADDLLMPLTMPKAQVLDRWHQHTRHCKACQRALKGLDQGLVAAQVVGLLAVLVTVPSVVVGTWPLLSAQTAMGVLVAAASAAAYAALANFRPNFFHVDYVHADRYAKP